MITKYKTEKTMQPGGLRWAVVFEGQYRFMHKDKDKAEKTADRMNKIHNKRISGEV